MARRARNDLFTAEEVAVVHVMNRVHHGNYLMGFDEDSGKDYSYRRGWFMQKLLQLTCGFAIDLLAHAIMSNHFHLILRSRPDIVKYWSDREVARRWLLICPKRKIKGRIKSPTDREINALKSDKAKIKAIRVRLSDISWLVRLVCQHVAQKVNAERPDTEVPGGKFFDNRFKAVRLLDEAALVACSIYVDANPIRAGLCDLLEKSQYASIQYRMDAMLKTVDASKSDFSLAQLYADHDLPCISDENPKTSDIDRAGTDEIQELLSMAFDQPDSHLAPLSIDEKNDPTGPHLTRSPYRCSDKGSLPIQWPKYLELLAWTVRHTKTDDGSPAPEPTPGETPEFLEHWSLAPDVWFKLVTKFEQHFSLVAGLPETVDKERGPSRKQHYYMKSGTRALLSQARTAAPIEPSAKTNSSAIKPASDSTDPDPGTEGNA